MGTTYNTFFLQHRSYANNMIQHRQTTEYNVATVRDITRYFDRI